MPKETVDKTLADGEQIARVWAENNTFTLGEVTQQSLQDLLTRLRTANNQVEQLHTELTAKQNEVNDLIKEVKEVVTRARSGFRAVYGPNSSQYEQAGGTRSSERRRPGSTKKSG